MAAGDHSGLIQPVILSGGVGTRLWPMSRALYPKQLLPLVSELTMLQETVRRIVDPALFAPPVLVCNEEHRFVVAEQVRQAGVEPRDIVLEPVGRNTAPAAAVAAMMVAREAVGTPLLLLPSDHTIADVAGFRAAVQAAVPAALAGSLVTFGMEPRKPETGYGYVRLAAPLEAAPGCFRVERFVEKPQADRAAAMLAEGGWYWNSGMFLFTPSAYLEELERLRPDMVAGCRAALDLGKRDLDFFRLDAPAFTAVQSDSIDYAVMEHTGRAAVVPASIGWDDIGSWSALWEIGRKDGAGNVTVGEVVIEGARNSYVRTDGRLVTAVGVEDLLVVATEDAVLVAAKDKAQDVKAVVGRLEASGRVEAGAHVRVYRPWGFYQNIDAGDGFQVKHLMVKAGAKLSLQAHARRAEHWVVVAGTARVTRGEEVFDLGPNQSTYIPIGTRHRLENPGGEPLRVIEVQSGDYLGEDDIVRFDDVYGRSEG